MLVSSGSERRTRRKSRTALHHLPGGLHGDVPGFEHVGKTAAVLGHIAEHPQGDLCEDAEGTSEPIIIWLRLGPVASRG